ncbi:carboxylesterase/phospholipase [Legionella busanensis]|uniref:Carboxylesterase/phospholipase n=1 Tax=Legionella busanensis TaxID=190655 RepID=A0A378JQA0_9GAMM|nr:alpha/beta fold hydrolase [Legionella busanensis]STX50302.1 carboxylesterase/phospholipase [Legionella busanensis]
MSNFNSEDIKRSQGCVIWMHGLGADGSDMAGLAAEYPIVELALEHLCLDAPIRPVTLNAGMPMRAWYDIVGLNLTDREDRAGILHSFNYIKEVIEQQISVGYEPSQIVLAGFSQGGAMALYSALHCDFPLAGVIALSAYLPLALESKPILAKNTPIFLASGLYDPIVLPDWSKHTKDWLIANEFNNITWRQYPMEHAICPTEITDIASWLSTQFKGA